MESVNIHEKILIRCGYLPVLVLVRSATLEVNSLIFSRSPCSLP